MAEIRLDPEPGILIESLRDIGYSFNSALADIVDNSITANASEVSIYALPTDNFQIVILDNGDGLTKEELLKAMKLGSSDPRQERNLNDLGRFGLGLKTASFSQCRKLTVVSKHNKDIAAFTWDLNLVVKNNQWTLIERLDYQNIPFLNELGDNGTLVLWEDIDRLTGSRGSGKVDYDRYIKEAGDYLALVFHRYLAGEPGLRRLMIRVNAAILDPIDPFNRGNKATGAGPEETVARGVTMRAYTLPHKENYDSMQEYEKYGLKDGYLKNQGFYLYRAKRLIRYGTWFGLAKKTAITQLTRIKIDIDVNQDELWKIDVKKVSAQMPEAIRARAKELIPTMSSLSKKAYKKRAAKLTNKEYFPVWDINQVGEKRVYSINRNHPIVATFLDGLDKETAADANNLISLIESSFPIQAMLVELADNDDDKVKMNDINDEAFSNAVLVFAASLKQSGKSEDDIVKVMRFAEPFASRWEETKHVLGIEEY